MPSPDLITPLPVYRFPNKLAPNVPNKVPRDSPLCSFAFFLNALLPAFINKTDSFIHLKLLIFSYLIQIFLIDASVAGAAANPNGIKTPSVVLKIMVLKHLDFSKFFIKGKPVFSNGTKILPKNPPGCPILFS